MRGTSLDGKQILNEIHPAPRKVGEVDRLISNAKVMEGQQPTSVDGFRQSHFVGNVPVAPLQYIMTILSFRCGGDSQQKRSVANLSQYAVARRLGMMKLIDNEVLERPCDEIRAPRQTAD